MDEMYCECGHDHDTDDVCFGCNCQKFIPLATFDQLKEAWELADKILKIKPPHNIEDALDLLYGIYEQARRIRGEKGA